MCVSFVHVVCLDYGHTTDAGGHIKSTTIHSTLGKCCWGAYFTGSGVRFCILSGL